MDGFKMIVDGFVFTDRAMAQKACQEVDGIKYVQSKLDMDNPRMALKMYQKLLAEQVFETPVGLSYLKGLQNYLASSPELAQEKLVPIRFPASWQGMQEDTIEWYAQNLEEVKQKERAANFVKRRAEEKTEQVKKRLWISLMLSLFLFIVAAGMAVVTLTSEHPNIVNYENKIIEKYETWETDLENREQVLKEREKELDAAY